MTTRWMICLLLATAACTDSKPDYQCDTPTSLSFVRNLGPQAGPLPALAMGGSMGVHLQCRISDYPGDVALDVPFVASLSSDSVTVDRQGANLVLHAAHAGTSELTIASPEGERFSSVELVVKSVDHVVVAEHDFEVPQAELAFAAESTSLAKALFVSADGTALFDDGEVVTPPPGGRLTGTGDIPVVLPGFFFYDQIPPGEYSLAAAPAAGQGIVAPFVRADSADSIALADPNVTIPASGARKSVCFDARVNGRSLVGLGWTYAFEGAQGFLGPDHCTDVDHTQDKNHDGMVTVTATAGGVTATIDIPVT